MHQTLIPFSAAHNVNLMCQHGIAGIDSSYEVQLKML